MRSASGQLVALANVVTPEHGEAETLRYENYLLKKELARLQKDMEALRAQLEALQAANG